MKPTFWNKLQISPFMEPRQLWLLIPSIGFQGRSHYVYSQVCKISIECGKWSIGIVIDYLDDGWFQD